MIDQKSNGPTPAMEGDNARTFRTGRKRIDIALMKNHRGAFIEITETNLDNPRRNIVIVPLEDIGILSDAIDDLFNAYQDRTDGITLNEYEFESFTTS